MLVTQAPFSLFWMLLAMAAMHVMIAMPFFPVAVAGQVAMGTVYVFFEQACQHE